MFSSSALEIYSLLDKDCQLYDGLIVGVDAESVEMLTRQGHYSRFHREDLRYLAVYNTIDNPIAEIKPHPRLAETLLEVYTDNQDRPKLVGWPVKFVENLVLFYDIKGKSHVFEMYKIRKLRPYRESGLEVVKLAHQPVQLSYKSWISQCKLPSSKDKDNNIVRPSRILGDQIQISEFFVQFEEGFDSIQSFKERTYVYAKPFLYERQTKMGILAFEKKNLFLSPEPIIPLYFQWSKGREFRFQSFNQLGSVPVEYLPAVEPLAVFRSDLKSHIFHASFVGNLQALSAGSEFFTPLVSNSGGLNQMPYDVGKADFKSHSSASINYMALMGGDWGPWSLSVGTYFPNYMVQTKDEFREILASRLAPLFRLMYTGENFRLRGLLGFTNLEQNGEVKDTQISRDSESSVINYLQSFSFQSHYIRVGVEYQISRQLEASLDELWLQGAYKESLVDSTHNKFDFSHLVTQASLRHYFGEYVALRAYLQFFKVNEDFEFSGTRENEAKTRTTFGGSFEFIF